MKKSAPKIHHFFTVSFSPFTSSWANQGLRVRLFQKFQNCFDSRVQLRDKSKGQTRPSRRLLQMLVASCRFSESLISSKTKDLGAICTGDYSAFKPECTKIARFSAVAAAIFTARGKIARLFEAPRCAISSAKKIASEPRFFLRFKLVKMILAAEFPAITSSAIKIASEQRCAILVHSDSNSMTLHTQIDLKTINWRYACVS